MKLMSTAESDGSEDLAGDPEEYEMVCPSDEQQGPPDRGDERKGQWVLVKVTADSGAGVDVMPEDWMPHVPVVPCTGTRRGKRLAAANNTLIQQVGEKRMQGRSDTGMDIDWRFIACNVKKALKSTASTCDDGKWVIHTDKGGWVIDTKTRKKMPMLREGNNYIMNVWVWAPKAQEAEDWKVQGKGRKATFGGQSAR